MTDDFSENDVIYPMPDLGVDFVYVDDAERVASWYRDNLGFRIGARKWSPKLSWWGRSPMLGDRGLCFVSFTEDAELDSEHLKNHNVEDESIDLKTCDAVALRKELEAKGLMIIDDIWHKIVDGVIIDVVETTSFKLKDCEGRTICVSEPKEVKG